MPGSASSKKAATNPRKSMTANMTKQMSHQNEINQNTVIKSAAYQQKPRPVQKSSGALTSSEPEKHDLREDHSNSTIQDFNMPPATDSHYSSDKQPSNQQDFISQYQQISYHHPPQAAPSYQQPSKVLHVQKKSAAVASRTRPRSQTGH